MAVGLPVHGKVFCHPVGEFDRILLTRPLLDLAISSRAPDDLVASLAVNRGLVDWDFHMSVFERFEEHVVASRRGLFSTADRPLRTFFDAAQCRIRGTFLTR